ncbi:hypothetical protein [Streptomyces sp. NPDC056291]|uniref:hypothetical protein n=1 Tax=Streptomyces sp. NPDC056291 TaxID=3345772 RepID=UPI0035DAF24A
MPALLRATTELVAQAWLNSLFDTPIVAMTLPKDTSSWTTTGFITITTVGGAPDPYVQRRNPVVSVDCWALNPNSAKPPWGKANHLAETVQAACWDHARISRPLALPDGFPDARVLSAYTTSEARRIYDDQASYAHYSLDLALHWVEL